MLLARNHPAHFRRFIAVGWLGALVLLSLVLKPASAQRQQAPAPDTPMPAILRNYQPVTAERLKHPEDANWLMIRRTYDGWGYSPLDQITPANVARLEACVGFFHRRDAGLTSRLPWSTTASCSSPRR